jgi:DNA-binding CsgD family transcriptional regulator
MNPSPAPDLTTPPTSSAPDRRQPAPLLEREPVLAVAHEALEGARSGHGATLFVVGEAGLGKSSVLAQLTTHAHGFAIGASVGTAAEARLPFGLIALALARLGGGDALTAEIHAAAGETRAARFYRSLRWLTEASARTPVLIVLDDLHWADPDTLDLVAFLGRRSHDLPVLIVAAHRRWPAAAAQMAGELARTGDATIVELAPLTVGAGAELLEHLLGRRLDDEHVAGVWAACAGNPLLLEVAAASLAAGEGLPPGTGTPGLVDKMLLARFAGVGETALRYAQAAAVYGTEFRPALVGPLAGLHEAECDAALSALCDAGLVRDGGSGTSRRAQLWARFVHPLFAQALVDDLPGPVCGRLHRTAYRLLMDRGDDRTAAAQHAVAAGLVGDPEAVGLLEDLGRIALGQGATATAAQHLDSAALLAGERPSVSLMLTRAEALVVTGRVSEAEGVCRRVIAGGQASGVALADALRHLTWTAHLQGSLAEGMTFLDDAVGAAVEAVDEASGADEGARSAALQILLDCAQTAYLLVGPARALPVLEHAASIARRDGPAAIADVGDYRAFIELLLGRLEPDIDAPPPAGRLAGGPSESLGGWGPLFALLNRAKLTERFDEAGRVYEEANGAAEKMGSPVGMVLFAVAHADTLARQGRLDAALDLLEGADAWAEFTPVVTPWTTAVRAAVLVERGRSEEATRCCDTLDGFEGLFGGYLPLVWLWQWTARCRLLLESGQPTTASDLAARIATYSRDAGLIEPCTVTWAGVALDAHIAASRLDRVRELVTWMDQASAPLPCRWPRAVADRGRAALAELDGDGSRAERLLADALSTIEPAGMPIARAELLVAQGSLLRRSGRPAESRRPLADALEIAEAAGAMRLAALARSELSASGGRRRRKGEGPGALTPQEERVARLAADGRTNREIAGVLHLSAKTVDHHLSRVYTKLGIGSRRDLMRTWPLPDGDRSSSG